MAAFPKPKEILLPTSMTALQQVTPKLRWRFSLIWLLCIPAIIVFVWRVLLLLIGSGGEFRGWFSLGVTLLFAPFLIILAYAGFPITILVGILAFPIVRSGRSRRADKVEAAIAFSIALFSSIWIWAYPFH